MQLTYAVHTVGLTNQPESIDREDGLRLQACLVAVAVRCAPPANKPTKEEFETCRIFVVEKLGLLRHIQVVVALGKIALDEYVRIGQSMGHGIPFPRPKCSLGVENLLPWM